MYKKFIKRADKTLSSDELMLHINERYAEYHEKEFTSLSAITSNKRAVKTFTSEGRSADEQEPTCHEVARQICEQEKEFTSLSAIK